MKILNLGIATTITLLISAFPVHAATEGYAVCAAVSVTQNKLFFTVPVATSQSAMEGMEARYVQMLRDKRYSNVGMYDPAGTPPPPLTVACQFYATQSEAAQAIIDRRKSAAENGYNDFSTSFDG